MECFFVLFILTSKELNYLFLNLLRVCLAIVNFFLITFFVIIQFCYTHMVEFSFVLEQNCISNQIIVIFARKKFDSINIKTKELQDLLWPGYYNIEINTRDICLKKIYVLNN